MLIKNPQKHVLTDYRIASLLGLTKPHPKTGEFVDIDMDGSCKVYRKMSKTLEMPIRPYSPTKRWVDAGPALEKFGHKVWYWMFSSTNMYSLPELMQIIVELHAEGPLQYEDPILIDLLLGKDWQNNEDLF